MKVLVVGVNGKTGRRVAEKLTHAGVQVRGVSRSTSPSFDWTKPDTWDTTLEGMDAAYLTYHPDLSVPEAQHHIQLFCGKAKAAGIEHVVLLSGRGEEGAARAEQVLKDSGLSWNVIQASWFAQNYSEDFMLDQILSGAFVIPAGTSNEPFIDVDDIADVAVATLLEPGLQNRMFEVTGPELLSFADCLNAISETSGRSINLIELPMEEYIEGLRQQNLPEYLVELLPALFSDLFDGRNAHVAYGVKDALGRPATSFLEYAKKAAKTNVWQIREQA